METLVNHRHSAHPIVGFGPQYNKEVPVTENNMLSKRKPKPRIAVLYTHFPHYRAPIFSALSRSKEFDYEFFYDQRGINETILNANSIPTHGHLPVHKIGPFMFQFGAISQAIRSDAQGFVFLGNPFIVTTWIASLITRIRCLPTLFWTHGWLREERGFKAFVRRSFYRLASGLLLYGTRARDIAIKSGFPEQNLHVVYNSLNYDAQQQVRNSITKDTADAAINSTRYFLSVGRLVKELELDLALNAACYLPEISETPFEFIIIGDGPLRKSLKEKADQLNLNVTFLGAVYDEEVLGKYFSGCAAVISPGKVGLLAMHALAYGAPVITHGELDSQMPEVEAIEDGVTGAKFSKGDARDLATKMGFFLDTFRTEEQRKTAIGTIEADYTPSRQAERIDFALSKELYGK